LTEQDLQEWVREQAEVSVTVLPVQERHRDGIPLNHGIRRRQQDMAIRLFTEEAAVVYPGVAEEAGDLVAEEVGDSVITDLEAEAAEDGKINIFYENR